MPEVKFQHIVSFNSEDKNNPAENLLKPGGFKKWKTATVGEKNATVVLQFEKSTKIHSIDIGNESSAFIEVLVGRSSAPESDYKVLLVASAFMNPLESRSNQNLNRVRLFEKDKLTKSLLDEKWDRIKIVCTQPFNKNIQYGLSFITIRSPDDGTVAPSTSAAAGDTSTDTKTGKTFGGFGLKKDLDNSGDSIKTGSLFAQRKEIKDSPPLTGAAAVRAAAKLADQSLPVRKDDRPPAPNLDRTTSERQTKYASTVTPTVKRKHSSSSDSPVPKRPNTTPKSTTPKQTSIKQKDADTSKKEVTRQNSASKPSRKTEKQKPFNELMKKVVFVMSGYKNPKRGDLRDKAIEMGAQYKPDWNDSCTHLICAFVNTPKFAAVKGKGRIVDEDWILDCHKRKKLLPWRKYRLSRSGSPDVKSESSSDEESQPTPVKSPGKLSPSPVDSDTDPDVRDSGGDTEDEIKQFEANKSKGPLPKKGSPTKKSPSKTSKDLYAGSTDEDTDNDVAMVTTTDDTTELPVLVDLFTNKHFLLYGSFTQNERKVLNRLIVAYNGQMEEYMNDSVNYVLTQEKWDDNFDKALSENDSLQFVNPEWIYKCDENQKLTPYQSHIITPVK